MSNKNIILTSELIRAARALLRWKQRHLAEASNVSPPTIKRLESKPGPLVAYSSTLAALRTALEDAGIEFVDGGRPGVLGPGVSQIASQPLVSGSLGAPPVPGGRSQAVRMGLNVPRGSNDRQGLGISSRAKPKPLTSSQIRAARALLRWSADDLSRESVLGLNTIKRAELADANTPLTPANDLAIRGALEAAGVEFIDANGGGPGVRLRTNPMSGEPPSRRAKR